MKSVYIFSLLMLLTVSCSSGIPYSNTRTPTTTIAQEEYAVYSSAINVLYERSPLVVIEDHTGLGLLVDGGEIRPFSSDDFEEHAQLIVSRIPNIDQETISSLRDMNQQTYSLENNFDAVPEVILISAQVRHDLIGNFPRQGWIGFHETAPYSKAGGIVIFSRVGFNSGQDKALVYLARQVDFNWCERFYLFFAKIDGKWILQDKLG
jgi:hypothetical protein